MIKQRHIYNFGVIGNGSYLGYIDSTANVVWLCWPRFDSSFIFGNLLDKSKGGEFSVRPPGENFLSEQRYIPNTNILITRFSSPDGVYEVTDFAPRFMQHERYHKPNMLYRKVAKISGNPSVRVVCKPVDEYGQLQGQPVMGSHHLAYTGLTSSLRLTTNGSLNSILNEQSFCLTEDLYMVLSWGEPFEAALQSTFEEFLKKTEDYWRTWVERCRIPDFAAKAVIRSALLLKIHQYDDTGAVIASGTTSLPEHEGSNRNWDYRYCWLRDSYFSLNALDSLNHFEEQRKYSHYIQNILKEESHHIQPLFKIDGNKTIDEYELALEGYLGAQPVRIGNAAYHQLQHDAYGQVILALLPLYLDERIHRSQRPPLFLIEKAIKLLEQHIDKPDAGIWEFRGKQRIHCTTALFHWAGASAAMRIAKKYNEKSLFHLAQKLRNQAVLLIEACYNEELQAYTTSPGVEAVNASDFLLITLNYLKPNSERAKNHLAGLEKHLRTPEGFIYRYQEIDDFGETKSAFLICCYWYIEALAKTGRLTEAMDLFERLTSTANSLGILSEDIEPGTGSQWGNFGQTYSHVGLINSAFRIQTELDRLLFEPRADEGFF